MGVAKAYMIVYACSGSSESSLLAHTTRGHRLIFLHKFSPLPLLDRSEYLYQVQKVQKSLELVYTSI